MQAAHTFHKTLEGNNDGQGEGHANTHTGEQGDKAEENRRMSVKF